MCFLKGKGGTPATKFVAGVLKGLNKNIMGINPLVKGVAKTATPFTTFPYRGHGGRDIKKQVV